MHRDLLCEALRIAINQAIPITGVLKSGSGKRWCSLDHLFSILSVKEDEATDALWLNLLPHSSDIGCAPVPTAIHFAERVPDQDQQIRLSFEAQVAAARDDGSARRAPEGCRVITFQRKRQLLRPEEYKDGVEALTPLVGQMQQAIEAERKANEAAGQPVESDAEPFDESPAPDGDDDTEDEN